MASHGGTPRTEHARTPRAGRARQVVRRHKEHLSRGRTNTALHLLVGLLVSLGWATGTLAPVAAATSGPPGWQTAWTSPTDLALGITANSTVRDVATVAISGRSLRLTFSNLWSTTPTTFSAVTVGIQQSGVAVVPGSTVPVTFNHGSRSLTLAAHARAMSDAVAFAVHAGESLSISIAVAGVATVSVHACCYGHVDSYATSNGAGNLTANAAGTGFDPTLSSSNMRWLSAIAVAGSASQGTVVAFGDSITDGYGYLNNGFSWVNALQSRIARLPNTQQMAIVNSGISGNTLTVFPPGTSFAANSGGLPGVTRLGADALSLPGVKDIVMLLGTNDIWFGAGGVAGHPIPPYGTASAIETGMRQVVTESHAHGAKVFGVTLLPRSTSTAADHDLPENWTPSEQAILSAVNAWMLSANSPFDAVINLSAVMSDVYNGDCRPAIPFPGYFNPDHLHPNVAGETVMADAISTTLFGLPQAPQIPQLITATPTPGCVGAQVASQVLAAGRQPATTTTTTTTTTTSTTTAPVTSTSQPVPASGSAGHYRDYAIIALIVLIIATLWNARRQALRRRALRRRALRPTSPPRSTPPRRPPPRSGPPSRPRQ